MKNNFDQYLKDLYSGIDEFCLKYPEKSSHLNLNRLKQKDPYFETLLHAIAYISANLEKKAEDMFSEGEFHFLRYFNKSLASPYPSRALGTVFLNSDNQRAQKIPKSTFFRDQGIYFKTLWDFEYLPIVCKPIENGLEISSEHCQKIDKIAFYLDCDYETQQKAWDFFKFNPIQEIVLLDSDFVVLRKIENQNKKIAFGFPYEKYQDRFSEVQGFKTNLWLDYFMWPNLFGFYDLIGLAGIFDELQDVSTVRIMWSPQRQAEDYFQFLRTNVVPMVNLYIGNSKSIQLKEDELHYFVEPEMSHSKCDCVIDVLKIIDLESGKDFEGIDSSNLIFKSDGSMILRSGVKINKKAMVEFLLSQGNDPYDRLIDKGWHGKNKSLNSELEVVNLCRPSEQYSLKDKNYVYLAQKFINFEPSNDCFEKLACLIWNENQISYRILSSVQNLEKKFRQFIKSSVLISEIKYILNLKYPLI